MSKQPLSPLALALTYLRSAAGWSMTELARALGLAGESLISAYERGVKILTREQLDSLIVPLGYPPDAVDVLLFAHGLIHPDPQEQIPSPVALNPEEHQSIDRAVMAASWTAGRIASEVTRSELSRRRKHQKIGAARQEAEDLFQRLTTLTPRERRGLIEAFPKFWSWALAVRVCEASVKSAAHKAGEALELAELAVSIAERVPGEESWRSRLLGYCWAHVGNARRVSNDLAGADEAFVRAWSLWRTGAGSESELLAEWRIYDLEASLRRGQRRFAEALNLLDQARASSGNNPLAAGQSLLQRAQVLHLMGDPRAALASLAEAAPLIEASETPRLLFALRFETAKNLDLLENYTEAEQLLPQTRELAIQQANELDLIRVVWLEARVAAGRGRAKEAIAGLEQVSQDFTARELPYDAALSSLDLSVLWLKAGRAAQVRKLADAMVWIFKAKGIAREALAALKVFCDAARQESATVELARQIIAKIERARHLAPPTDKGRGQE